MVCLQTNSGRVEQNENERKVPEQSAQRPWARVHRGRFLNPLTFYCIALYFIKSPFLFLQHVN
jgi:hypothetical protein